MDWNQSMLDTLRCSVWQQAKTHHVLKMLLVWLQLLAFVVQLVTSLFFPISFPLYLCSPPQCPHSVFVVFCFFFRSSLSFQSASLASDFFPTARASCLTLPLSPCVCVCVLNHNPVNPTSNGVYWERYQTWPLGLVLWLRYNHEKQGFNTICLTAFSEAAAENPQFQIGHTQTMFMSALGLFLKSY